MARLSNNEISAFLNDIAEEISGAEEMPDADFEEESSSENDDNVSVQSEEHDEISVNDEDDIPLTQLAGNVLRGKNGYIWSSMPPSSSRTPQRNIVNIQPRPEKEAFMLLFSKSGASDTLY
ncbi:unnamed protein product [Parnassius apollo]|uniref:(apollo) hypothetical protein n=1 Tax=Parnassius apollo TaxID=110799 RepID=A0A8S3WSF5_PARAO|nr:unnamed protein product [Parnassius apollo]